MKQDSPGRNSLVYTPSIVSWATADFIRKPPNLAARVFIYTLVTGLVIGAIYAQTSTIAVSVEAKGQLVTEKGLFNIRAPMAFKVGRLNIKKNQKVKKDELLIESKDQLTEQEFQILKGQASKLLTALRQYKSSKCADCQERFQKLAEYGFKTESQGQIRDTVTGIRDGLHELITAQEQFNTIGVTTANLQRQIAVAQSKLKRIGKDSKILGIQVENLKTEITQARAQIAEKRITQKNQVDQSINRLESKALEFIPNLEKFKTQQAIVAPISGIVSDLKVTGLGQNIQTGDDLLDIVPDDSRLVAELQVANKDISQVLPGMETKIKLDALPDREYGIVLGEVLTVPANTSSRSAASTSSSSSSSSSSASTYNVVIQLKSQSITKGEKEFPFRLGMTLTGYVVTKHETLLSLGIKKLFNIKDELLGQ